jgi:diguanylate cyclase (GGDEF)-like protein
MNAGGVCVPGSGIRCGLRRCFGSRGLLLLAALLTAGPACAVRRFDTRDGMSQNTVNAMAKDDLGFLWFASDTGLNRFDGRRFMPPPAAIAAELDGVAITALASAGSILWVGTRHDGIRRVDLTREQVMSIRPTHHGLPAADVRAIVIDAHGDVWLGTDGAGVVRIAWNHGAPKFTHYLPDERGLPHARIWTMAIDGDSVLAGTQAGVARLLPGSASFERLRFPAPFPADGVANIEEISGDGQGGYWIGTWDDGLFHIDQKGVHPIAMQGQSSSRRVTSLTLINGAPVVGFDTGIARYSDDCSCLVPVALAITAEGAAQRAFVRSLLALDDGGVFVGTWLHGAFHVPPNATVFERLQPLHPPGTELASERVQSVLEDRSGHVWIGSFGAGLQRSRAPVDSAPLLLDQVPIPSNARPGASVIWQIREDRRGRIWVGSDDGLDRYDPGTGQWRNFPPGTEEGLPGPGVRDLLELDDGSMLVATSSGLAQIDRDDHLRILRYASGRANLSQAYTINAIYRDALQRLWLATYDGVLILDHDYRFLHAYETPDPTHGVVRDLYAGSDGELLMASNRLCRIDSSIAALSSVVPVCSGRADGIPDGGIQAIERGIDGALWLSSLHGLHRIDAKTLQVASFHLADGLIADEFGQRASHAGASGRLYFGTVNGLQVFDPRLVAMPRRQRLPLITDIRVGGRSLGAGETGDTARLDAAPPYARTLTLMPGARQLILGFSLLGASRPSQQVEYRIAGMQDWLTAAEGGIGNYVNLPAGGFELYVRASEDDMQRGDERLALRIRVLPLWWERRSVQVASFVALLLGAWLLYQGRIRALQARERRLSNEVKLRTREIEQQKSELAVANQLLYELSIRDGLTGVFNRRHSLDEARRILRSEREREICVALIDLDHFKAINDRFGHIAGDETLRCFAEWLKQQAGPGDVFGRYGGEEFFCLLYDRDIHQARHWADTLLARARAAEIAGPNCEIKITASIGLVAIDPRAELPLEVWIARADAALYRAKANGRDSVLVG